MIPAFISLALKLIPAQRQRIRGSDSKDLRKMASLVGVYSGSTTHSTTRSQRLAPR